jgi:tetratricopeptide (TPR) repeat protein
MAGCARHGPQPPAGRNDAEYVDTAGCVTCHRDIAEAYRKTAMAKSFYRAASFEGKYFHRASDRYYEISGGGMIRYQIGFDGGRTNQMRRSIDYVVGSGSHARTFLNRGADGRLTELPVSRYSEKGGYFGMSPGYDRPDHEDFRRPVAEDCMFCHNAYPRKDNPLPEGIDCQRCHGPASNHAGLVNPAKLSRDRQMDVCQQCHLETTSSPLPGMIRKHGRAPFSYKPGEPLTDYAAYFDTDMGDRFEIAHQAYRLRKSACFLNSQMTCTTCHDPHREQTTEHFIGVCKTCHATAHNTERNANLNCLECHMWKRRADDVPQAVMTDHYIQRRKPATFTPAKFGTRVPYFKTDEPTEPLYFESGMDASKSGNQTDAIRWFEEALKHDDNPVGARRELAASLALGGDLTRAIEEGEKAGDDPVALTNLGNAYLQSGRPDQARRVLEKAPEEPAANNLLGLVLLQSGDKAGAERAFRRSINLQPDLAEANNNLGNLLAGRHEYAEAAWHFERAIEANPKYVEARHSYGIVLALTRSFGKARAQLEEALRLAPDSAEIRSDLNDVRRSMR